MNDQTKTSKTAPLFDTLRDMAPKAKLAGVIVAGVAAYTVVASVGTALMNDLGESILDMF